MTVEVETSDGVYTLEIDPASGVGVLTPSEFILFHQYVAASGFETERAAAGALMFIHLVRACADAQLDVTPESLLEAVT